MIKLRKKEVLAWKYSKLMSLALRTVNSPNPDKNKILKTLWDNLGLEPINPYIEFFNINKNISKTK